MFMIGFFLVLLSSLLVGSTSSSYPPLPQATQAQQAKLIDFLQTKVNTLEGRKKTLSDKIFGNKENARPGQGSQIPMAYSEVCCTPYSI